MTEQSDRYPEVKPGDQVTFERPGKPIYGGVVWQSPSTGDIIAGDTFLRLKGEWLPMPTGDVQVRIVRRDRGEQP